MELLQPDGDVCGKEARPAPLWEDAGRGSLPLFPRDDRRPPAPVATQLVVQPQLRVGELVPDCVVTQR